MVGTPGVGKSRARDDFGLLFLTVSLGAALPGACGDSVECKGARALGVCLQDRAAGGDGATAGVTDGGEGGDAGNTSGGSGMSTGGSDGGNTSGRGGTSMGGRNPSGGGTSGQGGMSGSGSGTTGDAGQAGEAGAGGEGGQGDSDPCRTPIANMVCLPAGTFTMGSQREPPLHEVTVRSFYMDVNEVTVAEYAECVSAGGCTESKKEAFCNAERLGGGAHPINCIDLAQAETYCAWVGKRLPTEEEWEYAARYPDGRTYPWGNEAPDPTRANACGEECSSSAAPHGSDGFPGTAPVGSFPAGASALGINDLAGNVWEFTLSPPCPYTAEPCTSCIAGETCKHPCGDCTGSLFRVHRGGSAFELPNAIAYPFYLWRLFGDPQESLFSRGFRCVRYALNAAPNQET